MATFAYSGRTRAGQTVTGERMAETMDAAVAALRREQILVTQINPVKEAPAKAEKKSLGKRVAAKNLAVFTRQFSVMIDAGLPLVQCLEILGTQEEDKNFAAVILATRGRSASDAQQLIDSSAARFPELPLVVLIDQGTAGAAEAVAGALQDHDRAAVLGSRSFGRGVTQRDFPLGSGASVRLTTAFWYTPKGRQIQLTEQDTTGGPVPPPSIKSAAGRTLVGGGGITPHQEVDDDGGVDRPLAAARALLAKANSAKAVLAQIDR